MSAVGGIFFFAALAGAVGQVVGGDLTDRIGRCFALLTSASALAGRAFEPPSGAMIADIAQGATRVEYYAVLLVSGSILYAVGYAMMGMGRTMPLFLTAMFVVTPSGGPSGP